MLDVGDKVRLDGQRQRYTIQARDDRFVLMTKPFNAKKTYIYTIADLRSGMRGPSDFIFGPTVPFDNPEDAAKNLEMLRSGEQGISRRRSVEMSGEEIALLASG